jgi:LysM repeat protein
MKYNNKDRINIVAAIFAGLLASSAQAGFINVSIGAPPVVVVQPAAVVVEAPAPAPVPVEYFTRPGDTIRTVAASQNVQVETLVSANPVNDLALQPGQKINLPAVVPAQWAWDGTEYFCVINGDYYFQHEGRWIICDRDRLARFHGWEHAHPDWRNQHDKLRDKQHDKQQEHDKQHDRYN